MTTTKPSYKTGDHVIIFVLNMSQSATKVNKTDTQPEDKKWKFPNSNRYHEYECVTVQVRSENGFADLNEVTDNRIEASDLQLCENCKELHESNDGDVPFSRDNREGSMSRVTVRIPESDIQALEAKAEDGPFSNRCEVIREAIKEFTK